MLTVSGKNAPLKLINKLYAVHFPIMCTFVTVEDNPE